MSGEAFGGVMLGVVALAVAGPIILAVVAGGAVLGLVRGAGMLVEAAVDAHRRREEEKRRRMEAALAEAKGSIGEAARKFHAEMDTLIERSRAEEDTRRREIVHEREAAIAAFEAEKGNIAERMVEAKKTMDAAMKLSAEKAARSIQAFEAEAIEVAKRSDERIEKTLNASMDGLREQLTALQGEMDKQNELTMRYANNLYIEASSLHAALRSGYEWEEYAPERMKELDLLRERAEEALREQQYDVVVSNAGKYAAEAQRVQILIERRMAEAEHAHERLEAAVIELEAVVEATHGIGVEVTPENRSELEKLGGESPDMDYWSQGKLAPLWEAADRVCRKARTMQPGQGARSLYVELAEIQKLRTHLETAHAYARAALVGRVSRQHIGKTIVASYKEAGWTFVGAGFEGEDSRKALIMHFTKPNGAREEVQLLPVYNEATGLFAEQMYTIREDEGEPNEQERAQDRAEVGKGLRQRGLGEDALPRCDERTRGRNGHI